jgi:glycerate 2-kinase
VEGRLYAGATAERVMFDASVLPAARIAPTACARVLRLAPRPPTPGWRDEPLGLAQRLAGLYGGCMHRLTVTGPLGEPCRSAYAFFEAGLASSLGRSAAVIDVSAAAGFGTRDARMHSPLAGSYGVGQLIRAAFDAGARHLVLDCDDSLGRDGGAGMLQALGALLLDAKGWPIGSGAAELKRLARIDPTRLDPRLRRTLFEAAVDWHALLLGPQIDGPGGAGLGRFAHAVFEASAIEVADLPGGGSAGGVAAGAKAFLGARLVPRERFLDS